MHQLGEVLGKTLGEIGEMPVWEARSWVAYFHKKAADAKG